MEVRAGVSIQIIKIRHTIWYFCRGGEVFYKTNFYKNGQVKIFAQARQPGSQEPVSVVLSPCSNCLFLKSVQENPAKNNAVTF